MLAEERALIEKFQAGDAFLERPTQQSAGQYNADAVRQQNIS